MHGIRKGADSFRGWQTTPHTLLHTRLHRNAEAHAEHRMKIRTDAIRRQRRDSRMFIRFSIYVMTHTPILQRHSDTQRQLALSGFRHRRTHKHAHMPTRARTRSRTHTGTPGSQDAPARSRQAPFLGHSCTDSKQAEAEAPAQPSPSSALSLGCFGKDGKQPSDAGWRGWGMLNTGPYLELDPGSPFPPLPSFFFFFK